MQRLSKKGVSAMLDDRGAAAVWMALLLVPIMIVAALAIDIGAAHADQQRLQVGADAAALAVAQDCARGECTAAVTTASVDSMAAANEPMGGPATGEIVSLDQVAGSVEVRTSSERDHWFAPIIGVDDVALQARSAARWGYPTGGSAVMPIAFSWCELVGQTGVTVQRDPVTNEVTGLDIPADMAPVTIFSTKSENSAGCYGPSDLDVPGGFGWLAPTDGCSATLTSIDAWQPTSPGNAPSNSCTTADFQQWIGRTTLLPVYDQSRYSGDNAEYQIFGYIAFQLQDYYFAGTYPSPDGTDPCGGNDRCVVGSFERFVDLDAAFDFSPEGPAMGAAMVALQLPAGSAG